MWLVNSVASASVGMNRQLVLEYYANDFVIKQLLENSQDREVAGAFWDGTYDQRPNILQFPSDILQMVKKGVTSFHFSVEHWTNPMAITTNIENYDKFRKGWDVIIDIDSKMGLGESKIAARLVCELLEKYDIKNAGIKFSGRRGFHIVLPWIMFPKAIDYMPAEKLYPAVPRAISGFIREKIKDDLMKELIKSKGAESLLSIIEERPEEMSPYFFVEIEKGWGNRHMVRAPFSLNEKTWLASIPIAFSQLEDFDPITAQPKNVIAHYNTFVDFFKGEENEAQDLLLDAMDWYSTIKKEKPQEKKQIVVWENKITEEYFPPCIKNILAGMSDGRKRSIFTLVNFLRIMNWSWPEVEQKIFEWNEKNRPPLPRSIILGHLRYSQNNQYTTVNCPPDGDLYYTDTGVCKPDNICKAGTNKIVIKNPIVYPFKLMKVSRKKKTYRGYSCGVCEKQFKNMGSLNLHKSRTHGYVFEV